MYNQMPFAFTPMSLNMPNAINAATTTGSKTFGLFSKLNFSSILTNTSKILNLANQAIPLYHQAKPIISNIRTLSRIGKEFTNAKQPSMQNQTLNNENNYVRNDKKQEVLEEVIPKPIFFL